MANTDDEGRENRGTVNVGRIEKGKRPQHGASGEPSQAVGTEEVADSDGMQVGDWSKTENGATSRASAERVAAEDWSAGVTWNMIALEMAEMKESSDSDEGAEGDIRIITLDVENAVNQVGRLRKTAVL
ncbi:hypothetical protein R1sor_024480 [Riccia sorocarpa]|uniref:Uncharacterized protein n=1 Tax=Riccia sorocarpa TaxID=122646 RepID=A0ABD3GT25_9MARC